MRQLASRMEVAATSQEPDESWPGDGPLSAWLGLPVPVAGLAGKWSRRAR